MPNKMVRCFFHFFTNQYHMKKIVLSVALVAGIAASASAQALYIKLNGGGALRAAGTEMGYDVDGSTSKVNRGSLGSGLLLGGAVGYNVSDNLSAELGATYLSGFKQKSSYKSSGNTSTSETYAKQWRLTPSAVFRFGDNDLQPYTKIGVIIPVMNKIISSSETQNTGSTTTKITRETSTGLSLGWLGALGVQKSFGERSALFVEAGFQSLSLGTRKSVATDWRVDGRDVLVDQNTYSKETEYVKELTSSGSIDTNKARQDLRSYMPFSNVNLNIGLQINL